MITIEADLAARRAAAERNPAEIPSDRARSQAFTAQLRAATVERDGKSFFHFNGYASTVEQPYEMWDWYGPYEEVVDAGAFNTTLAAEPDVVFLLNHRGTTMARTKSKTLELAVDATGLITDAYCNPERVDVQDLRHAVDDGDIDEMSFAFRIVRGQWSPDYTEYRILEVDLDRGDVSAVNFGANPNTSISARAKSALAGVEELPLPILRALVARGEERLAPARVESTTRATSYAEALLRHELAR